MKVLFTAPAASYRRRISRHGSVFIFTCAMLVTLSSIASLAVDYAHVELVKTQLHNAADAAAFAGADQLASGSSSGQAYLASTAAIQVAASNLTDNQPTVVLYSDVQVGNWDTTQSPAFSISRLPTNAVQVTTHRCAARASAVPLIFGAIFGANSCDVSATAIAQIPTPMSNYGIAGINHLNFGSLGVLAKIKGDVASNGDIGVGNPLGALVSVSGTAATYSGYISHGGLASIGSPNTNLSTQLNYPAVLLPTSNNNASIAAYLDTQNNFTAVGYASIPAGQYVVHDLDILADVNMDLQGPVTFYVTGNLNMAAAVNLLGNTNTNPSNFSVKVASGGGVNFLGNILAPLAMDLYAPQSAININVGISNFTGELIGQTVDINLPILGTFTEVKPSQTSQPVVIVQ